MNAPHPTARMAPSNNNTNVGATRINSGTTERALTLLGSGVPPESVAAALGVSVSRISQLLSEPDFAAQVAELRFNSLQKHNTRDNKYDELEDQLVDRMRDCLPLMMRPMEILKAIQIINAAKRRGASAPDSITAQQTIISLTIPMQVIQKFQTTQNLQVTHAGDQELLTIQASTLLKEVQNAPKSLAAPEHSQGNSGSRASTLTEAARNL